MKLSHTALAALFSTVSTLAWAQQTPEDFRTPEFMAHWGLQYIGADVAYAAGVDGSGVTIGILDSGLDITHPEFAGRYETGIETDDQPWTYDLGGHGTSVAGVAVANRDGVGMHGVAPGAKVVMARVINEETYATDTRIVQALDMLLERGVRLVNFSYGNGIPVTSVSAEDYGEDIAAFRRFVDAGGLVIVGTANAGLDQPSPESGAPYTFPELQRGWLAVTATDTLGIPLYANYCGVAKNWCLAAPGGGDLWKDPTLDPIMTPEVGGGYGYYYGTSLAAPLVAGAAALVWEMFPYLNAQQVGQILLGTATDYGPNGVDEIWGYGELNVGRAVMGPGRFDWGDFHANVTEGVSYWRNDIAGEGGLIKTGEGLLVLSGFNTYAGGTRIVEGGLALDGVVSSPVQVEYLGNLMGQGLVIGDLDSAGFVIPGDAGQQGFLSVLGDYRHRDTGVLVAAVNPEGATNALLVLGEAGIEGGEVFAQVEPGLYRQETRATFLLAAGGVNGRFAGLVIDDYVFLKGALEYQPDRVDLTISRLRFDDPAVAASANQRAVGGELERALSTGSQDVLLTAAALQQVTDPGVARQALGSFSGDMHATLAGMARDGGARLASGLSHRMNQPAAQSGWIQPYGEWGDIDGDAQASGADTTSSGFLAGFDRRSDQGLQLGLAFGFDRTDAEFDAFAGKGRIEAWQGAIYGRQEQGAVRADAWLGYGRLETRTGRNLQLGDASRRAVADYDGARLSIGAEAGRSFQHNWGRIEPLAGLGYTWLRQDHFEEDGAGGLGLAARTTAFDSLASSLGVRAVADVSVGAPLTLDAQARWNHEFLDRAAALDARFLGVPDGGFTATGVALGRDSAVLGLGVSGGLRENIDLRLNYDATLNAERTAQAVSLALRVTW